LPARTGGRRIDAGRLGRNGDGVAIHDVCHLSGLARARGRRDDGHPRTAAGRIARRPTHHQEDGMTPLRSASAVAATIALTAACASSTPATATTPPAVGPVTALILISGFAFDTQRTGDKTALDVAKGTAVTWSNKDGTTHHVASGTSPTSDGKFDGAVAAGATFSLTFNDAGTFTYFCSIHPSMTGTITVK
jgi:plastocyanin